MNQADELQSRVTQLEARLIAMEKQRKRSVKLIRVALLATVVTFGVLDATARVQSADQPATINAKQINIVGADGKSLLTLSSDANGGTVAINSIAGAPRIRAGINKVGNGELYTSGKDGVDRIMLSADQDGGYLRVNGTDGEGRAIIACQSGLTNAGLINIRDSDGKERVNIGSDDHGGQITIGSEDEQISGRLGTDARGGNLYLYGADHRAHIVMATGDGNVGLVNTRDGAGHNRVIIGYDNDGGQVIVNGTDDKVRAGMLVGDDGTGQLSLFDKTGKLKTTTP